VLNRKSTTWDVPASFKDYGQYFKAGDYNQTSDYASSTIGTKNNIYTLTLTHQ
jgi:hypothetical protein